MDFDGNAAIIVKYGIFTLAYSRLLDLLARFKSVLPPHSGVMLEQVCAGVDDVVGKLLCEGQPASLDAATQHLQSGLRYERDLKTGREPKLAPIYDDLSDAIQTPAPTWDYQQDIGRWHRLGRDLACRFYSDSPHSTTRGRLTREARLSCEWTREGRQAPFGYREDRIRAAETPVAGTITVRFCFSEKQTDSFTNYLAYPFYFVHEYVSHIHTISSQSDMFTDGWLLFSAQRFLRRLNVRSQESPLLPEQIDAIDLILPQSGLARKGYNLARRFQTWADAINPGCFDRLTFHLAAVPNVSGLSHTKFLWMLERELDEAEPRLRRRLEMGDCHPESLLENL